MNTLPRNAQSSARGGASNSVRGRRLPESSANGAQNNGSRASSSLVDAAGDRFAHLYYNDDTVDERRVEDAIMIYRQHQIPHSTNSRSLLSHSNLQRQSLYVPINSDNRENQPRSPVDAAEANRIEQIRKFNSVNFNDSHYYNTKVLAKNGEIFYASKSLLCAQSDVFRVRFSGRWDGTDDRNTIPTHCDSTVVEPLVRFVQTGKPGDISTVRVKLFEAADYYGLENLEILVVKSMTNNFSINTVLCYLELAFKYENKLQTFKQNVLEYAVKNMREIVELSGWKKFYEKHHTIVHALLTFGR